MTSKSNESLSVTASEFQAGQAIPARNSADGGNTAPTITWSKVPTPSKSVVLIAEDPDANGFTHWVVYNIPATSTTPRGGTEGKNSAGAMGYFGPKPPPGKEHHYHFHVYALDVMIPAQGGLSKEDVEKAMSGHVLAQGELVGVFQSG